MENKVLSICGYGTFATYRLKLFASLEFLQLPFLDRGLTRERVLFLRKQHQINELRCFWVLCDTLFTSNLINLNQEDRLSFTSIPN